jgi:hypothetical protein
MVGMEGRKPMTPRQLARLLKPFAVSPTTIWNAGKARGDRTRRPTPRLRGPRRLRGPCCQPGRGTRLNSV